MAHILTHAHEHVVPGTSLGHVHCPLIHQRIADQAWIWQVEERCVSEVAVAWVIGVGTRDADEFVEGAAISQLSVITRIARLNRAVQIDVENVVGIATHTPHITGAHLVEQQAQVGEGVGNGLLEIGAGG